MKFQVSLVLNKFRCGCSPAVSLSEIYSVIYVQEQYFANPVTFPFFLFFLIVNVSSTKYNIYTEIERGFRMVSDKIKALLCMQDKKLFSQLYLQGAVVPKEVPNAETIASIDELESGGGTLFNGSTEELFAELMGYTVR